LPKSGPFAEALPLYRFIMVKCFAKRKRGGCPPLYHFLPSDVVIVHFCSIYFEAIGNEFIDYSVVIQTLTFDYYT
jgi:hypothetical protein